MVKSTLWHTLKIVNSGTASEGSADNESYGGHLMDENSVLHFFLFSHKGRKEANIGIFMDNHTKIH